LWLDGGHNAGGGAALAVQAAEWQASGSPWPLHLIVGMKGSKVVTDFLRPLLPLATTLWAVAEPGQHMATPVERIIAASGGIARPGPTVAAALAALPRADGPARVLVCGSLYLAGEVLKQDAA
jgi:dihydrofolate synthase/folylpolyglutamate synthase